MEGLGMPNPYIQHFKKLSLSKSPIIRELGERYDGKFNKEVTEVVAVLKHIRKILYRHPSATLVDVGSGRGLLTAVLAELYPHKHIIAVDKNKELNTFVYDHYTPRVWWYNIDFTAPEFVELLKNERMVVLAGIHLCYSAAISFVKLVNTLDNVAGSVLMPCCMKPSLIPEEYQARYSFLRRLYVELPGLQWTKIKPEQVSYITWCMYLKELHHRPAKIYFDKNVLSPKNCLIVSKAPL